MVGFGKDINKESQGSVLTDLSLLVRPTSACLSKYSEILNDDQHDFHYLIKNSLPNNFNEDSLICASQPGKTSGSCPGDSGGIFMSYQWKPDIKDDRAIQTAVVHGGAQKCNGGRYPPIFVRIDNKEAIEWINSIVFNDSGTSIMISLFFLNGNIILSFWSVESLYKTSYETSDLADTEKKITYISI